MGDSARADKIISQAAQWTFEGDCSLLAWMQELSQNLEQRASATNDALQQLAVNVNRTAIALDNAANSLTALQYTQFVESRCHDDDETLTNTADTPKEVCNEQSKTTNEVLETFLQRNLQMLNNSHEKYSLDFEDSDEDESVAMSNCIYQPKNPYNDDLLPHIYGSKLWKEHWHVGLCDGSNEYSGDEASDAFSESSRSSAADNESYESNTANLSEWASSTSIPIEHKHPAHVVAQNVAAITTATAVPPHSKGMLVKPHFPSNDDSDTYSTTSRSTTTNPPMRQRGEHDLFATLRHDTPVTSSSSSSSPQQQQQYATSTLRNQRNVLQTTIPGASMLPPYFDATPPDDIFDEAATTKYSSNRTSDVIPQRSAVVQSKVKPVNLFDDEDFNSFMTDVVEKPQAKADQPVQMPVPAIRNLPTKNEATKQAVVAADVDLFAESLNIERPIDSQATMQINIEKPTEVKQRKPINLFDSPENSPPNDSLLSSISINERKGANALQKENKPSITPKSLFDDDEDDDDFLNVFGSKKLSLPQRSAGKILLFDDDSEEPTQITTQSPRLRSGPFDNTPSADNGAQSISTHHITQQQISSSGKQKETAAVPKVDLFADFEDKIEENPQLTSAKVEVKSQSLESKAVKPKRKGFTDDLFGDENNDDLNDLFNKQSKIQEPTAAASNEPLEKVANIIEPTPINSKEITKQKSLLFENEFEDNDLFSNRLAKKDFRVANDTASINVAAESPKINVPGKNQQTIVVPTQNIVRGTSLFADDFDEEDNDLFSARPNTKAILNANLKSAQTLSEQEKENQSPAHPATTVENTKSFGAVYQQRPLFEHDVEDREPDLFKSDKEIAKDSNKYTNKAQSESQKASNEPANNIFEVRSATKPFKELESNAAASENVSNKDVTVEQQAKDKTLTNQIWQESEKKTADTQSSKESRSSGSKNSTEPEKFNSLTEVARSHLEFKSDFALPEKIIATESMSTPVQQTANTATDIEAQDAQQTTNTAADIEAQLSLSTRADAHNLEYPNIFLDEPPDDDDFFTTLSSNTKPLSVSKLTLDFESDFYEPALPATPAATSSTAASHNQKDLNNKQQQNSSDYGGLRLFSEIPPDDDDEDFGFVATTRSSVESAVPNQRFHSVFYDDFPETLEAVQQIKEKQTPAPALFDDKPPLDNEHYDIREKVGREGLPAEVKDNFASEIENNEKQLSSSPPAPSKDVTDDAVQKQDTDSFSTMGIIPSPAGKLQMPNIKINVQALLPGGTGRPNFKKSPTAPEVERALDTTAAAAQPRLETSKEVSSLQASSSPATSENILPSVCKTRVRAPAGRRPSTRRARQENYRQSLLAEQAQDDNDDSLPQTNAPSSNLQRQPIEPTIASSTPTLPNQSKIGPSTTTIAFQQSGSVHNAPYANLFEDVDDEDEFLFNSVDSSRGSCNIPVPNADINATNIISHQKTTEKSAAQTRPVQDAVEKRATHTKDFSDDDADDLFKGDRQAAPLGTASQINPMNNDRKTTTKPSTITVVTNATKSLFGTPPSEDSDEDLFQSSKLASKATTATTQITKPLKATTTTALAVTSVSSQQKVTTASVAGGKLDLIFGSDDEDDDFLSNLKTKKKITTTLKHASTGSARTQASGGLFSDIESDEDDLFGGGKSKAKQDTNKSRKVTIATKTQLAAANATQKPTKVTSAAKNPVNLADNPLADLLDP